MFLQIFKTKSDAFGTHFRYKKVKVTTSSTRQQKSPTFLALLSPLESNKQHLVYFYFRYLLSTQVKYFLWQSIKYKMHMGTIGSKIFILLPVAKHNPSLTCFTKVGSICRPHSVDTIYIIHRTILKLISPLGAFCFVIALKCGPNNCTKTTKNRCSQSLGEFRCGPTPEKSIPKPKAMNLRAVNYKKRTYVVCRINVQI